MNEKEFYENLSTQLLSELEKERESQARLISDLNNTLINIYKAQELERNAILSRMQNLEFGLMELLRALNDGVENGQDDVLQDFANLLNQFLGQFQAQFKPLYERLGIQLPEFQPISIESSKDKKGSRGMSNILKPKP